MVKITLDAATIERLKGLTTPLVLCDEQGHTLARVQPLYNPAVYGPLEPQISEEELRRREENPGRLYTTEEVIAHLESL
ncbi:MAG TPA: hypothetical protein VGH32_12680 [Pirellulales bacterium]|jgi:hypothetical protein